MRNSNAFPAFCQPSLSDYLEANTEQLRQHVLAADEDFILNVDREQYIDYLSLQFQVAEPRLDFPNITADPFEVHVPAEHFPSDFHVIRGKSYRKTAYRFFVPFAGDRAVYRLRPSRYLLQTIDVSFQEEHLCFEVLSFRDDPNEVKQEKERMVNILAQLLGNALSEVRGYNQGLRGTASQFVDGRIRELRGRQDLLDTIGVRRRSGPATYQVPVPRVRDRIRLPSQRVTGSPGLDPTLAENVYFEILSMIYDFYRQAERLPSTYSGKSEEELRDLVLLYRNMSSDLRQIFGPILCSGC